MGFQLIGFLAFCFIGMTLINRVLEGSFIEAADIAIVNQVVILRPVEILGLFSIPVPNLEFFTVGIPRLVKWDYSFFGGDAAIIQYFLYSFTMALAFLLFTIVIGLLYQFFSKVR